MSAGDVAIALAIARICIAQIQTVRAFGFQMVDRERNHTATLGSAETLCESGAVFGVDK